ncbi:hypothetical protein BGZ94_002133 [Podila epigama]|nr:hypothetical protein BGZ94_002133 [Podila epigama]
MDFRFASLPYKKFDTTVLRNVLLKNPRLANLDINFGDSLANCNEWEPVPWIEKLDLHGAKITAGVLQLLQHCPNITSLAVALHANCSWGDVYEALGGAGGGAKLICLEFHRPRVNYTSDRVMMYGSNSIALRILEATTSLVKLTLPFDAFVVDSCTAIIDHCSNTLQYLTLDIDKMKMATVFSINKLLRSCPQLRHLAIHGKDYSHGWFHLFEPQWNALKLESFIFEMHFEHKAIDFADDVHNLEALDECFSFYVNLLQEDYLTFDKEVQMNGHSKLSDTGFEFVQVRDVYNIGLEMGLDNPAVDKLLGALERHFEHERQYIASIEESGCQE